MLMPDRQSAILKAVTEQGSCRVAALSAALGVSGETIRRDVAEMARDGLVRKVYGGVGLPDPLRESGFRHRLRQNADAKRRIAQAAAREIRDGDAIMMDTGSTTAYVAEALRAAVPPIYSIYRRNLGILHHHRIPFPACIRSSKSSRTARRSTQKSLPCDSR